MRSHAACLTAGVLTMLSMGILYLWGVFLLGLEQELSLSRSTLSLVSSAALVTCTCGFLVYDRLLRTLPLQLYLAITFALAAGGHLLFGLLPGYATLLVGYGGMFGLAVGLGYGLALALASRVGDASRGIAISIVVSAFAMSGAALAAAAPWLFSGASTSNAFTRLGAALVLVWALAAVLLRGAPAFPAAQRGEAFPVDLVVRSPLFLQLGLVFFALNYCGLMLVAHGTGLFTAYGAAPGTAALSPVVLNLSYIIGSLLGGRAGEALSPRVLLVSVQTAVAGGVLLLMVVGPSSILALDVGVAILGASFGGAAAFMPVLIGRFWGASQINGLYGVMLLAYGGAGIVAPWASALLFGAFGGYAPALALALAITLAGLLSAARIGAFSRTPVPGG